MPGGAAVMIPKDLIVFVEELEGRDICVVGTVMRDASRAEIAVSSPASIKLANLK